MEPVIEPQIISGYYITTGHDNGYIIYYYSYSIKHRMYYTGRIKRTRSYASEDQAVAIAEKYFLHRGEFVPWVYVGRLPHDYRERREQLLSRTDAAQSVNHNSIWRLKRK